MKASIICCAEATDISLFFKSPLVLAIHVLKEELPAMEERVRNMKQKEALEILKKATILLK